MAKVYSVPEELPEPDWSEYEVDGHFDHGKWQQVDEAYLERLREWCKSNSRTPRSELVGETIHFPVADGQATYMVLSTRPLELLHVRLGDGYAADPILERGLRTSDVRERVAQKRKLAELFGGGAA
jgi:hypothetical protein